MANRYWYAENRIHVAPGKFVEPLLTLFRSSGVLDVSQFYLTIGLLTEISYLFIREQTLKVSLFTVPYSEVARLMT